jgi:hypothetical protein
MIIPLFCLSPAWAADYTPVVTDENGVVLADGGKTIIRGATDVFVAPEAGAVYYYTFADSYVDVYYTGAPGDPSGSIFDAPFAVGSPVAKISDDPDNETGIPVDGTGRIEVPAPQPGTQAVLKVIAYQGDTASGVYTHVFALDSIIVTDGGTQVYQDYGTTAIRDSINVYISPNEGTEYFYTFGGDDATVDVYYTGETGDPTGSILGASFVNGTKVLTISTAPDKETWTSVSRDDDYQINVPKPEPGEQLKLKIAAFAGDVLTLQYSHTFVLDIEEGGESGFSAVLSGDKVVASIANYSSSALRGSLNLAIYAADGKLAYFETGEFNAPAGGTVNYTSSVDLDDYPENSTIKVFCWDEDYIPLFDSVAL